MNPKRPMVFIAMLAMIAGGASPAVAAPGTELRSIAPDEVDISVLGKAAVGPILATGP